MNIVLSPQRRDDTLEVAKVGDTLTLNGESFDFSRMMDGDTLPIAAIRTNWFAGDVDKKDGEITLSLLLPLPQNYSQEQAFPVPLRSVPDGPVALPQPLPSDEPMPDPESWPVRDGIIDWSKLITAADKEVQEAAERLARAKADLASRNSIAAAHIDRINDRVETLGYGIEGGEATLEDEAEHASLLSSLKAWKAHKFALGKVTTKDGWFESPQWPVAPMIPEIIAAPLLGAELSA